MTGPSSISPPRFTLRDFARALGIILHKEIGVPFMLYDTDTGALAASSEGSTTEDQRSVTSLTPSEVYEIAERGQADVRVVAPGSYQMSLVLHQANRPTLVAAATFTGLAKSDDEADRESRWLCQWLRSVGERLRLSEQLMSQKAAHDEQPQDKSAWEGLLALDRLIRQSGIL